MKIVALDVSANKCGISIINDKSIFAETIYSGGITHSINIISTIMSLLKSLKICIGEVCCFGITVGPGTFTGIRIGIVSILGAAFGFGKPVIGINSLDALAFPFRMMNCFIIPIVVAKKGEVYYRYNRGGVKKNFMYNMSTIDIFIKKIPNNSLIVGDISSIDFKIHNKNKKNFHFNSAKQYNFVKSSSVALITRKKMKKGFSDEISLLKPIYMKNPDIKLII